MPRSTAQVEAGPGIGPGVQDRSQVQYKSEWVHESGPDETTAGAERTSRAPGRAGEPDTGTRRDGPRDRTRQDSGGSRKRHHTSPRKAQRHRHVLEQGHASTRRGIRHRHETGRSTCEDQTGTRREPDETPYEHTGGPETPTRVGTGPRQLGARKPDTGTRREGPSERTRRASGGSRTRRRTGTREAQKRHQESKQFHASASPRNQTPA